MQWRAAIRTFGAALVCIVLGSEAGAEDLTPRQRLGEALVLGLRLRDGVDLDEVRARFAPWGVAPDPGALDRLEGAGLLERCGPRLRLTDRGVRLANEVFVALV